MTIAQIFEYEKKEGAKSFSHPLVLQSPKKHNINSVKYFGAKMKFFV